MAARRECEPDVSTPGELSKGIPPSIKQMSPKFALFLHDILINNKITLPEGLPIRKDRGMTPEEVFGYLISFNKHEAWMTTSVPWQPPPGSVFMFNRQKLTNYRKDGYNWMRKKGATNTTRIDRLTLKVFGHDIIHATYCKHEREGRFRRRAYWINENRSTILVHYFLEQKFELLPTLSDSQWKELLTRPLDDTTEDPPTSVSHHLIPPEKDKRSLPVYDAPTNPLLSIIGQKKKIVPIAPSPQWNLSIIVLRGGHAMIIAYPTSGSGQIVPLGKIPLGSNAKESLTSSNLKETVVKMLSTDQIPPSAKQLLLQSLLTLAPRTADDHSSPKPSLGVDPTLAAALLRVLGKGDLATGGVGGTSRPTSSSTVESSSTEQLTSGDTGRNSPLCSVRPVSASCVSPANHSLDNGLADLPDFLQLIRNNPLLSNLKLPGDNPSSTSSGPSMDNTLDYDAQAFSHFARRLSCSSMDPLNPMLHQAHGKGKYNRRESKRTHQRSPSCPVSPLTTRKLPPDTLLPPPPPVFSLSPSPALHTPLSCDTTTLSWNMDSSPQIPSLLGASSPLEQEGLQQCSAVDQFTLDGFLEEMDWSDLGVPCMQPNTTTDGSTPHAPSLTDPGATGVDPTWVDPAPTTANSMDVHRPASTSDVSCLSCTPPPGSRGQSTSPASQFDHLLFGHPSDVWTTDRSTNGNVVSTSSLSRHTTSGNESTESSSSLSRHVSCGNLSFPSSEDVSVHVVSSGYQSGLVPSGSESVVSSHSLSRHVSQDEGTYGVVFVGREIGGCGTDFEDSSINIESGDGPSVDEILSMLGVVSQDESYFGSDFSIPLQSDSQHGNGNRNKEANTGSHLGGQQDGQDGGRGRELWGSPLSVDGLTVSSEPVHLQVGANPQFPSQQTFSAVQEKTDSDVTAKHAKGVFLGSQELYQEGMFHPTGGTSHDNQGPLGTPHENQSSLETPQVDQSSLGTPHVNQAQLGTPHGNQDLLGTPHGNQDLLGTPHGNHPPPGAEENEATFDLTLSSLLSSSDVDNSEMSSWVESSVLQWGTISTQPNHSGETLSTNTGVAPPTHSGVAPPTHSGVAPPTHSGVAPPTHSGVAPPTHSGVAPPTHSGVSPPTHSGVAPPTHSGGVQSVCSRHKRLTCSSSVAELRVCLVQKLQHLLVDASLKEDFDVLYQMCSLGLAPFEDRVIILWRKLFSLLMERFQGHEGYSPGVVSRRRPALIHLAAGLGMTSFLEVLKKLSANVFQIDEFFSLEFDPLSTDDDHCTSFFWACFRGQESSAFFLLHWVPSLITLPDKHGTLPLEAATQQGHTSLVDRILSIADSSPTHPQSQLTPCIEVTSSEGTQTLPPESSMPPPSTFTGEGAGSRIPSSSLSSSGHTDDTFLSASAANWHRDSGIHFDLSQGLLSVTPSPPSRKSSSPLSPSYQTMSSYSNPISPTESSSSSHTNSTLSLQETQYLLESADSPSVIELCELLSETRNVHERDFANMDLSDNEHFELIKAARTIQSAFRKFSREKAKEKRAALTIESYYKRYREMKRQNHAARVIQQHYRLYKQSLVQDKRHEVERATRVMKELCRLRENEAACKIQRFLRQYKNKHHHLPRNS